MALRTVQRRTVDEKKKKGELENKTIVYDNYAPVTERVQVYDKPDTSTSRQRLEQAYATANLRPETVKTATTSTPIMQALADRADRQIYHSKYGNAKLGLGQGFAQGITAGFAGSDSNKYFRALNETQRNDLLNSGGYKAGNMVGRMAGASLAMKGGEGLLQGTGALNRLTSSGIGQKVTNALGNNAALRSAFAKGLGRAGEEITEAGITNAARDLTGRAITNAITDIPYGVVQSVNENNAQGLTVRDPEYWKNLGVNLAMDIGVDSALDFGPTLVRGLRGATKATDADALRQLARLNGQDVAEEAVSNGLNATRRTLGNGTATMRNAEATPGRVARRLSRAAEEPVETVAESAPVPRTLADEIREYVDGQRINSKTANRIYKDLTARYGEDLFPSDVTGAEKSRILFAARRGELREVAEQATEDTAERAARTAVNRRGLATRTLGTEAELLDNRGVRFTNAERKSIRRAIIDGDQGDIAGFAADKVDDLIEKGVIGEDEAQAALRKLTSDISSVGAGIDAPTVDTREFNPLHMPIAYSGDVNLSGLNANEVDDVMSAMRRNNGELTTAAQQTVDRRLADLDAAHRAGGITDEQYDSAVAAINDQLQTARTRANAEDAFYSFGPTGVVGKNGNITTKALNEQVSGIIGANASKADRDAATNTINNLTDMIRNGDMTAAEYASREYAGSVRLKELLSEIGSEAENKALMPYMDSSLEALRVMAESGGDFDLYGNAWNTARHYIDSLDFTEEIPPSGDYVDAIEELRHILKEEFVVPDEIRRGGNSREIIAESKKFGNNGTQLQYVLDKRNAGKYIKPITEKTASTRKSVRSMREIVDEILYDTQVSGQTDVYEGATWSIADTLGLDKNSEPWEIIKSAAQKLKEFDETGGVKRVDLLSNQELDEMTDDLAKRLMDIVNGTEEGANDIAGRLMDAASFNASALDDAVPRPLPTAGEPNIVSMSQTFQGRPGQLRDYAQNLAERRAQATELQDAVEGFRRATPYGTGEVIENQRFTGRPNRLTRAAEAVEPETIAESAPLPRAADVVPEEEMRFTSVADQMAVPESALRAEAPTEAPRLRTVADSVEAPTVTRNGQVALADEALGLERTIPEDGEGPKLGKTGKAHVNEAYGNYKKRGTAPDEVKENLKRKDFLEPSVSNERGFQEASEIISRDGDTDKLLREFREVADGGQMDTNGIYYGQALHERLINEGRFKDAAKVEAEIGHAQSINGQTLQAQRTFYHSTPQGKVALAQKAARELGKKYGVDIELPDELLTRLKAAADGGKAKDLWEVTEEINKAIWKDIPPSISERINSWRYLAMLGNPRTHVRNFVSNVIYAPVRTVDDFINRAIQSVAVKPGERTGTVFLDKNGADKKVWDFVTNLWETEDQYLMKGTPKFEMTRPMGMPVFSGESTAGKTLGRALDTVSDVNSAALDWGDAVFSNADYKDALARFLKARGADVDNLDPALLEEAREFARNHALSSTFRSANALSQFITKQKEWANVAMKDMPKGLPGGKAVNKVYSMVWDSLFPFVKTPSNILEQAYKHSPAGLIRGARQILTNGGDTAQLLKGIENLSKGMTGTGILGLGYWFATNGWATGSIDSNSTEGKYAKMKGEQEYALRFKIGDDWYSFTMDWAAPEVIPFFIGVEAGSRAEGNESGKDIFGAAIDGLTKMTDPVFSMSMLSGLQNAFSSAMGSQDAAVREFVSNTAQSYANQFIPTLAGQVARTLVGERRTTTSTASNQTERQIERYIRQVMNKLPGANQYTEPYVDELGRTDNGELIEGLSPMLQRGISNAVLPGYMSRIENNTIANNLDSLMGHVSSEDAKSILPKGTSTYDVTFDDKTYRMSESELTTYKENRGGYARENLNSLFNSSEYQNMSAADKVKAVKDVYADALQYANDEFLKTKGYSQADIDFGRLPKETQAKHTVGTKEEFVAAYNATKGMTTSYKKSALSAAENGVSYEALKQFSDVDENTYWMGVYANQIGITSSMFDSYSKAADADGSGRRSKDEITGFLDSQDLTNEQRMVLYDMLKTWNGGANPYQ